MTLSDIKAFQYNIPFTKPLSIHGHLLRNREGVILQLSTEQGVYSLAEMSPLPGASTETWQQSINQLKKIRQSFLGQNIITEPQKIRQDGLSLMKEQTLYPSLHFGLEAGIYTLIAATNRVSLAQLLKSDCETHIYVNGLLQGNQKEILGQAEAMINNGIKTYKLKVGSNNLDDDINKVLALKNKFGQRGLLRIDANQAWDLKEAVTFGKAIGLDAAEYIEEPVKDIQQIPEFFMETMIPSALDETLITHPLDAVKSIEGVDVFIAKPTLLGGIEKTLHLINQTQQLGIRTVLSSCFESGVGMQTLINLAACGPRHVPVGLDTLKWFAEDTLTNPYIIQNGYYELNTNNLHMEDIDQTILQEIAL